MKHIQFVRVPWGISWFGDARYYGRRWGIQLGPWLVFLWQMNDAQMGRYHAETFAPDGKP